MFTWAFFVTKNRLRVGTAHPFLNVLAPDIVARDPIFKETSFDYENGSTHVVNVSEKVHGTDTKKLLST